MDGHTGYQDRFGKFPQKVHKRKQRCRGTHQAQPENSAFSTNIRMSSAMRWSGLSVPTSVKAIESRRESESQSPTNSLVIQRRHLI